MVEFFIPPIKQWLKPKHQTGVQPKTSESLTPEVRKPLVFDWSLRDVRTIRSNTRQRIMTDERRSIDYWSAESVVEYIASEYILCNHRAETFVDDEDLRKNEEKERALLTPAQTGDFSAKAEYFDAMARFYRNGNRYDEDIVPVYTPANSPVQQLNILTENPERTQKRVDGYNAMAQKCRDLAQTPANELRATVENIATPTDNYVKAYRITL